MSELVVDHRKGGAVGDVEEFRVVALVEEDGRLVDLGTGSVWDPVRGRALEGPLAGEVLDQLPGFTSFPGDYERFFPDGRIWDGAGLSTG